MIHDYAASKAAIISLTKSFSEQLGEQGIRVNCVAPGPFWSPLQITGGQPQLAIPQFGQDTPLGRAGQPVELSGTYVLLAQRNQVIRLVKFLASQVASKSIKYLRI